MEQDSVTFRGGPADHSPESLVSVVKLSRSVRLDPCRNGECDGQQSGLERKSGLLAAGEPNEALVGELCKVTSPALFGSRRFWILSCRAVLIKLRSSQIDIQGTNHLGGR